MKRIIVEGVDGSGKTTLIQHLIDQVPGLRIVPGFMHSEFKDYTTFMSTVFQDHDRHRSVPIHDRFFYSELVYGPIIRGGSSISPDTYQKVIDLLRRTAFLIYCRPPLSTLQESIKVEKQMDGVEMKLSSLYDEYEQVMTQEYTYYEKRLRLWDFTKDGTHQITEAVRGYLGRK